MRCWASSLPKESRVFGPPQDRELWSRYILGEAEPGEAEPDNKVVPFARRADV